MIEKQRKVFIARHGETQRNKDNCFSGGKTDSSLTSQGEQDTLDIALWFLRRSIRIDRIITSPLERSRLTGQAIQVTNTTPVPEVKEEARELDFGDFDGMPVAQVLAEYSDFYFRRGQSVETKVQTPYPNGESPNQALIRATPLIDDILTDDKDVTVIVGHEYINQALISGLTRKFLQKIIHYHQQHREVVEIDLSSKTISVHNIDNAN